MLFQHIENLCLPGFCLFLCWKVICQSSHYFFEMNCLLWLLFRFSLCLWIFGVLLWCDCNEFLLIYPAMSHWAFRIWVVIFHQVWKIFSQHVSLYPTLSSLRAIIMYVLDLLMLPSTSQTLFRIFHLFVLNSG